MTLILATLLVFALVGGLIYVLTELVPRWRFLKRHKVHKSAFKQFDMTSGDDDMDRP